MAVNYCNSALSSFRWQYNHMLALGKKMRSGNFTYQIANAGQGIDHKATKFEQIR